MFCEDADDWDSRCQLLWVATKSDVIEWVWQRDTVALTVALVTGNNLAFGRGLLAATDDWYMV